jgi:tetratricopeptide (TPR) repeat protein
LDTTPNTWRRFSAAYSKTAKTILLIALAAALGLSPARAQQPADSADPEDELSADPLSNLDPLSRAVERNPLTLIRIAALGFTDPVQQGEALNGLVAAFLASDKPDDATVELRAIDDTLWRARALLHLSDFQKRMERLRTARETLDDALALARPQSARDGGGTLKMISTRYLDLGAYQAATDTALLIPDKYERIGGLMRVTNRLRTAPSKALRADSKKVLAAAFDVARTIKPDTKDSIETMIRIAEFQLGASDFEGARKTLSDVEVSMKRARFDGADELRSELAATLVLLNDRVAAQDIVRGMIDAGRKSRGMASIARATAQRGDIDAAVSLFTLARQEAMTITDEDKKDRYAALTHLIVEETRVGRLADAFKDAGLIRERKPQAKALLGMGQVLIAQEKMKEAIVLVDYVPYIGMRTQIFAPVALYHGRNGDREKASKLLARALEPTRFEASPEELAKALPMVIDVQARVGVGAMNETLFKRIETQLDRLPDDPSKIEVLTGIASAEARAKRQDQALRALAAAWRIAWLNRRNPQYTEILTNLMRAQIDVGEFLQAFDTAARVPDGPTPPKPKGQLEASLNARNLALQRVAVAAAAHGHQRLAIRAARRVRDDGARARVFSEIARAFPVQMIAKVTPSGRSVKVLQPRSGEDSEAATDSETGSTTPTETPPVNETGNDEAGAGEKPAAARKQPAPKKPDDPNAPQSLVPFKN